MLIEIKSRTKIFPNGGEHEWETVRNLPQVYIVDSIRSNCGGSMIRTM